MVDTKYDKYFIEYDPERWPRRSTGPGGAAIRPPIISRLDNSIVKGSNFYVVVWFLPDSTPKFDFPMSGHPPHIHKDAELLFHIGTNPDDPMDLGAEVELYMGKEMERHVITKSSVVYIPPNFIHAPWRPVKTERPWIFIEVNQGPKHTEKFYPQLLPREIRDKTDWSFWKDTEDYFSLPLCSPDKE